MHLHRAMRRNSNSSEDLITIAMITSLYTAMSTAGAAVVMPGCLKAADNGCSPRRATVVLLGLGYVVYRRYFSHIDIFASSNVALIIIIYSLCSSSLLIINKARTRSVMARPLQDGQPSCVYVSHATMLTSWRRMQSVARCLSPQTLRAHCDPDNPCIPDHVSSISHREGRICRARVASP